MTKYQLLVHLGEAELADLRALFGKDKDSVSGEGGLYAQAPLADHLEAVNAVLRKHFAAPEKTTYHGQKNVGWDPALGPTFFHTFKFPHPLPESLLADIDKVLKPTTHTAKPLFSKLGGEL